MTVPTSEELRKQARKLIDADPRLRKCTNCFYYDPPTSICIQRGVKTFPLVLGCNKHELTEERIIADATETLYKSPAATEDVKIDHELSLGLTMVNGGTLFLESCENRIRKIRNACNEKEEKRGLRKDLDLFERLIPAAKEIVKSIEAIEDSYRAHMDAFAAEMETHLGDIDAQYRHYFQEHLNKIFKKNGKYDGEQDYLFLSSAGSFCITILERLKQLMEEEGELFPFNEMDMKRYKIKK